MSLKGIENGVSLSEMLFSEFTSDPSDPSDPSSNFLFSATLQLEIDSLLLSISIISVLSIASILAFSFF